MFTTVNTDNAGGLVTTRVDNVDSDGFDLALSEDETAGGHGTETVSWIAIEPGSETLHGFTLSNLGSVTIDETLTSVTFGTTLGSEQCLAADMNTSNDTEPAVVRYDQLDKNGVDLKAREDQEADTETDHGNETAVYLAYNCGSSSGETGISETLHYTLGGQRIALRVDGDLQYLFTDHLGSASVTYDGTTTRTQRYYPWGNIRSNGNLATDVGFTGQRLDQTTGLMHYQARYYDATIGRFISADTIVPNPTDPQDLNRYSYVLNGPVRYADPTGHCVLGLPCPEIVEEAADLVTDLADDARRQVVGAAGNAAGAVVRTAGDAIRYTADAWTRRLRNPAQTLTDLLTGTMSVEDAYTYGMIIFGGARLEENQNCPDNASCLVGPTPLGSREQTMGHSIFSDDPLAGSLGGHGGQHVDDIEELGGALYMLGYGISAVWEGAKCFVCNPHEDIYFERRANAREKPPYTPQPPILQDVVKWLLPGIVLGDVG